MALNTGRPAPEIRLQLFSRRLVLSAGSFRVTEGERVVGQMRRGLQIAVMLDSQQSLKLDDRPAVAINGPALLVAAGRFANVSKRGRI